MYLGFVVVFESVLLMLLVVEVFIKDGDIVIFKFCLGDVEVFLIRLLRFVIFWCNMGIV